MKYKKKILYLHLYNSIVRKRVIRDIRNGSARKNIKAFNGARDV